MLQDLFIGSAPNDKTGTPARQAGQMINDNFAYLNSRITTIQSPDAVLKRGNIETSVLNVHVDADAFEWRIAQIEFLDNPVYDVVLDAATDGYYRKDVLLGNNTGGYNIFKGNEDPTSATEPNLFPNGTIKLGVIDVYGAAITGSIVADDFELIVNKQNSLIVDGTGVKYPTVDAVNAALLLKANDNTVLHKTGNESFSGVKLGVDGAGKQLALLGTDGVVSANTLTTNNTPAFYGVSSNSQTVFKGRSTSTGLVFEGGNSGAITSTINSDGDITGKSISAVTGVFTGAVSGINPTANNHFATKAYADGLLVGLWNDRGNYNPNTNSNAYPSTGGSGTAGAIIKGNAWMISGLGTGVTATIGTKTVNDGDVVRALVNTPGNTDANWAVAENNIGFTPANDANVIHTSGAETKTGQLIVSHSLNSQALGGQNTGSGIGVAGYSNTGFALFANATNGIGLRINHSTGNTSRLMSLGVNNGEVLSSDYLGNLTANSFVKTGASASDILLGNGTTIGNSSFLHTTGNENFSGTKTGNTGTGKQVDLLGSSAALYAVTFSTNATPAILGSSSNSQPAIVAFAGVGGSGNNFEGRNQGATTFTVNKVGDVSANGNFIATAGKGLVYDGDITRIITPEDNEFGALIKYSASGGFRVYQGSLERMRIASNGNMGIGVTNPQQKVHTNGAFSSAITNPVNGNVFGTYGFSVSVYPNLFAEISSVADGVNWYNSAALIFKTSSSGDITASSSIERMRITGTGNVLIGTTTDTGNDKLQVRKPSGYGVGIGDNEVINGLSPTGYSGLYLQHTGNSNNLTVCNGGGKVLVGTPTDNGIDRLQVNGTISTTGVSLKTGTNVDVLFNDTPVLSSSVASTLSIDFGAGSGLAILESFKQDSNDYGIQRITYTTGTPKGKMYVRVKDAGTWTSWVEK
ncbi:hypothetical protein B0A75_04755 [Flavobacterium oncorhynchi]|uniref:Uncharacterized protein n=1 Tax=Flavobacterium oncorhynchi TaxID=728056 RepID=A0A226I647_9FLAO|nr:hypothetical protein [Flavobacterium oncorhynchi]OXB01755.1 hypothetical protein B0A75_04755 [Flavobacterium oncorhynchi]